MPLSMRGARISGTSHVVSAKVDIPSTLEHGRVAYDERAQALKARKPLDIRKSRLIIFAVVLVAMVGIVVWQVGGVLAAVGNVHR